MVIIFIKPPPLLRDITIDFKERDTFPVRGEANQHLKRSFKRFDIEVSLLESFSISAQFHLMECVPNIILNETIVRTILSIKNRAIIPSAKKYLEGTVRNRSGYDPDRLLILLRKPQSTRTDRPQDGDCCSIPDEVSGPSHQLSRYGIRCDTNMINVSGEPKAEASRPQPVSFLGGWPLAFLPSFPSRGFDGSSARQA